MLTKTSYRSFASIANVARISSDDETEEPPLPPSNTPNLVRRPLSFRAAPLNAPAEVEKDQEQEIPFQSSYKKIESAIDALLGTLSADDEDVVELNRELNNIIEANHCSITTALSELKDTYQKTKAAWKRVSEEIFLSAMTMIDENGQESLIGLAESNMINWHTILASPNSPEFTAANAYGPSEAAKEACLPENTPPNKIKKYTARSLDRYLSRLGYSPKIRLKIYTQLHQGSLGHFPNKPEIEAAQTKVLLFTIDLKMQQIVSNHLLQFQNPHTQEKETLYYRATCQYEQLTPSYDTLTLTDFPNLESLLKLPKFPLFLPEIDSKGKEEKL